MTKINVGTSSVSVCDEDLVDNSFSFWVILHTKTNCCLSTFTTAAESGHLSDHVWFVVHLVVACIIFTASPYRLMELLVADVFVLFGPYIKALNQTSKVESKWAKVILTQQLTNLGIQCSSINFNKCLEILDINFMFLVFDNLFDYCEALLPFLLTILCSFLLKYLEFIQDILHAYTVFLCME